MRTIGRIFDERDTFVRLLLVDVSGLGYLLFRPMENGATTTLQWVLAVAAFVFVLVLYRWPLASFGVQVALLVVALFFLDDVTINEVGASWTLLELAMWARRPAQIWWAAGLLGAVYLGFEVDGSLPDLGRAVFGMSVVVGLPLLLGLNIRSARALARHAEERAAQEQRRVESESRAARADERSAIARELHDVVAHHVASMVLRVAVARHVLPDTDPRIAEVFDDVHSTGTAALADLRHLVAVLRDPDAVRGDAGLIAIEPSALPTALRAAVERAQGTGLTIDADISPSVGTLDAVRGLAVLRLTQEAMTNVAKHAGDGARATLTVSVVDGDVHWSVSDDGGRPPLDGGRPVLDGGRPGRSVDGPVGGGHGLTGMRERVEVLGGRLEAGPAGAGWLLRTVLAAPSAVPPSAPPSASPSASPSGSSSASSSGSSSGSPSASPGAAA
jgi:signal transduction histidine kinase